MTEEQEVARVLIEMLQAKGLTFEGVTKWVLNPWYPPGPQDINHTRYRRRVSDNCIAVTVVTWVDAVYNPTAVAGWRIYGEPSNPHRTAPTITEAMAQADAHLLTTGHVLL